MFEHLDDTRPLPAPTADEVAAVVGGGARLRRRTRRLRIAAVAVPTAVVVAAVAVVVGTSPFSRQSLPDPATSGSPSPAPTGAPGDGSIAPDGPYEALTIRGTRLVAVDSTGRERPVRDLRTLGLTAADAQYGYISTAGWLAVPPFDQPTATTGHELVDLTRASAAPVLVTGLFDGRTWSPDGGRLFTMRSGGLAVIIDAATGRKTVLDLQGGSPPGGGPELIWTADGTGVLVQRSGPVPSSGNGSAIAPIDGGPLRSDIPALWRRFGERPPRAVIDKAPLAPGYVTSEEVSGISPDDKAALIPTFSSAPEREPGVVYYLVPLDGGPPVDLAGSFAGWVPTSVVDQIIAAAG